jgi:C_GCAxxG_C_C family probable redox protein
MDKTTGLNVRDGKGFNCCESVLTMVDEVHSLPGFESNIMKAASTFGGGVGGWGGACGATSGAVMALGLVYGYDGEESLKEFQDKKDHAKEVSRSFMKEFEEVFGSVNCSDLWFGLYPWTEESEARYNKMKAQGFPGRKCDDFIDWSVKRVLETIGARASDR